jgi:hypothetical protein
VKIFGLNTNSMSLRERKYKETYQCGSVSEGIPRDSDAIIPRQVPI